MVIRGLKKMRENPRPGVKALLDVSGSLQEAVNTETIGFRIGRRINAAGRLESADTALLLLLATDDVEAAPYAQKLNQLNEERQRLTQAMQIRAAELVGEPDQLPLIFAASADFQQGIVGLVAGRLTEQFYRPSVILHLGEEESHGSCRSIEGFNITNALDECAELLIWHGGHAQAAGFAVYNANLELLRDRLLSIAERELGGKEQAPTVYIDSELRLHELTEDLYYELKRLEPTGTSNPAPLFCSKNLRIVSKRRIGKDGSHLKLNVADYNCEVEAIAFRMGALYDVLGELVHLAYHLDLNEWNGTKRLQMVIEDIQQV